MASKRGKVAKDNRRPAKPCFICGIRTVMGVSFNHPPIARERWNGKEYVRFCSPEHEVEGGW